MICELCKVQNNGTYGSGRFCSAKCARSFSTFIEREKINEKISLTLSHEHSCKECGEDASRRLGGTGKFCEKHKRKHWKDMSFEDCRGDAPRKKKLIQERGYKCWECGISEWRGKPAPLQLDHIDGNSDNSSRENLRILCAMCHAQTPTWGSKNVGRFHTKRMKRRKLDP